MNAMMLSVVRTIAERHDVSPRCVQMVASAYGPSCWRGCVPVSHFEPRYAKGGMAPLPERRERPRRRDGDSHPFGDLHDLLNDFA